jgi:hypothetical protein
MSSDANLKPLFVITQQNRNYFLFGKAEFINKINNYHVISNCYYNIYKTVLIKIKIVQRKNLT